MVMAAAHGQGEVANKCARCAREQKGGVARFSVENNAVLDDIQGTPFDGATEAEVRG